MKNSKFVVIALLSFSIIGMELSWTRIFSAEFFYTYAFLILSLAILGLSLGSLALKLFPKLNNINALGYILSLCSVFAVLGPILVFKIELNFSELYTSYLMIGKLLGTVLILSSGFFVAGIGLGILFKNYHREMPRLYMFDLIGAGLGVLLAIYLMNSFGTPMATFLLILPLIISAIIVTPKFQKVIPLVIGLALLFLIPNAENLLEKERKEYGPVIYKHWDAMSKIKIFDFGVEARGINIDNMANTPIYAFDGNWNRPDSEKYQFNLPVDYLIKRFDSCVFLSLGSGGGADVLQALQEGATEIHAVEVNPQINRLMLFGDINGYRNPKPQENPADSTDSLPPPVYDPTIDPDTIVLCPQFSGYIYSDPRVQVHTEDARAYIRKFENKFDLIYSASSNTWAALASGSFALAENYIFTTDAYVDYWKALSENGFLVMEHQFYMPRLVSEVIDALNQLGIENPKDHFAVYNLPQRRRKVLLMSKQPLDDSLRYYAIAELNEENKPYIYLEYPITVSDSTPDNVINQIVQNGWETMQDSVSSDISPVTDNRPFVAQQGLWKNFKFGEEGIRPYEFYGFPLTKVVIAAILLVVLVIIIPLNLIPFLTKTEKLKLAPWLYFFAIGMAFMIIEVVLIQKYTLLVGPSVYSISAILFTLLIASGIGSRFSQSISENLVFPLIIGWVILDIFLFKGINSLFGAMSMTPRILITVLFIAPLGFFMGMPFPKATLRVGSLIDWGFAVNGAASVLGSTLIIVIAMNYGFNIAMLTGAGCYLVAYLLYKAKNSW